MTKNLVDIDALLRPARSQAMLLGFALNYGHAIAPKGQGEALQAFLDAVHEPLAEEPQAGAGDVLEASNVNHEV